MKETKEISKTTITGGNKKMRMKNTIITDKVIRLIESIERTHPDIQIVYACELGYRGWIYAPNYDYHVDMYFIYKYKSVDSYLILNTKHELKFSSKKDDSILGYGYDIRTFMEMINRGDHLAIEILNAKLLYRNTIYFDELKNDILNNDIINLSDVILSVKESLKNAINTYSKNKSTISVKVLFDMIRYVCMVEHMYAYKQPFPVEYQTIIKRLLKENENNKVLIKYVLQIAEPVQYTVTSDLVIDTVLKYVKKMYYSIDTKAEVSVMDKELLEGKTDRVNLIILKYIKEENANVQEKSKKK